MWLCFFLFRFIFIIYSKSVPKQLPSTNISEFICPCIHLFNHSLYLQTCVVVCLPWFVIWETERKTQSYISSVCCLIGGAGIEKGVEQGCEFSTGASHKCLFTFPSYVSSAFSTFKLRMENEKDMATERAVCRSFQAGGKLVFTTLRHERV